MSDQGDLFEAFEALVKDSNPKDAVGIRKAPMSAVSGVVMMELGLAFMEGARKYGRHNYRAIGVRSSVYYDAAMRHLMAWWEGEEIDPDSGLSHITKAIATLTVLRDAQINEKVSDDRPPPLPRGWLRELNERAGGIIDKHPESKEPYVAKPLGSRDTSASLGYHKITCAVYNLTRGECTCGAGDSVEL